MCRYDDDYAWELDTQTLEVAAEQQRCEDCGRPIGVGEQFWQLTGMPVDYDDRPLIFAAMLVGKYLDAPGARWIEISEDHIEVWERAGFRVDEDYDPRTAPEPILAEWCQQCCAANHWLAEVCHQHTLLVTCMDLVDHTHDYDAETLGPHFMVLAELAGRQWRDQLFDQVVGVEVVQQLAENAVVHAVAVGLHP